MLGIIQGLTEFLPVSSSGHLQIFSALFGLEGEENLTFAVAVHAATVCSTIVILWKEVSVLFKGFFVFKYNDEMAYVLKIFLSMIPVAIVGFCFKDYVEALFGSGLTVVGCMLLVTAVIRLLCKTPGERENLVPGCVCDRIGASVCRVARFVPFRFDYCNRYIVGKQEGGGGQILFFDGVDSHFG